MKKIFIICPVRIADDKTRTELEEYAEKYEKAGYQVHLPHRDTDQTQSGLDICIQNASAISASDEVHIFYDPKSSGSHFDMGVAFAMDIINGRMKKIVIAANVCHDGSHGGFPKMLEDWMDFRHDPVIYDGSGNGTY